MKKLDQIWRLAHINFVLIKHGIYRKNHGSKGKRIRNALEELGPVFVKFGQTLSTRGDLLPEDIINELEKLQDQVPPFSSEEAKKIIEKIYGCPINETFLEFNPCAKASASVAQVHEVTLHTGEKAIIKILRPNIKKNIRKDISLLFTLARLVKRYCSDAPRLRPYEIVKEFENIIFGELNLMREAANESQLRRNFLDSKILYVPKIHWQYAKEEAIVIEHVEGVPISDIKTLKKRDVNLKLLAKRGVEIFFTQVFRDCFFHADMHPGNIFVNAKDPKDPQYIAVDFGIMGSLNPTDQLYLAANFLAFLRHDYRHVAKLHIELGWVSPNTRIDELESEIRTISEPIFGQPLRNISFGSLLLRLLQMGKRFDMQTQPQLFLLQKTLFHIEGLGKKLYPDLNIWETAKPFLEEWMSEQSGTKAVLQKLYKNAPFLVEKLPEMPQLIYDTLQATKQLQQQSLRQQFQKKVNNKSKRTKFGYIILGMCIGFLIAILYTLLTGKI